MPTSEFGNQDMRGGEAFALVDPGARGFTASSLIGQAPEGNDASRETPGSRETHIRLLKAA